MPTDLSGHILNLILSLPAFVVAFTLHEFAHAWMATRCGDDLARRMGRLTLDPLAHLDPFGSMLFVLSSLVGFGIGYAKPVPFNPRNLGNPRRDTILIAIAGPISNLLQVPFWLALLYGFRVLAEHNGWYGDYSNPTQPASLITTMLQEGIIVNILLAVFNMIPLPPLDGHHVLEGLGPPYVTDFFNSIRPYSLMIVYALSYFGFLSIVFRPFIEFAIRLVNLGLGNGFNFGDGF